MLPRLLVGLVGFLASGIDACDKGDAAAQGAGAGAGAGAIGPPGTAAPAAENEHARPERATPTALAAGQWTRYRPSGAEEEGTETTMKIVGVEEEATWLEVDTPADDGRRVFKVLARLGDRTDADAVEVRAVVLREGDRTRTLEGRTLRRSREGYGQWAGLLVARWEGLSQEDVVVAAGMFRGAYRGRHETTFGPFAGAGAVWHHPDVPVTGMVRFRGDAGATLELVEFGTEGATSAFGDEETN